MCRDQVITLRGITRVPGTAEGEALVTSEKLSHLANAIGSDGVIRMQGHPLQGKSYSGKIIVYDTDKFSTGGAFGLYFKAKIGNTGPLALICRTVHPISVGGAVDAEIPAVDGFDVDPCVEIRTGDWVKISAPRAGEEAIVEVHRQGPVAEEIVPRQGEMQPSLAVWSSKDVEERGLRLSTYQAEMLDGRHGKAKQLAMERLVKFGQGMGSKRMVRIRSAHIFCDWKTDDLTAGAWPLYEEFANLGAKVVVPATMESTWMADDLVDDEGMPWHYVVKTSAHEVYKATKSVNDCLQSMGVHIVPTCIPYMHLNVPRFGECHATSESNAAAYSNAMLGARINRDPGNMVLYAAITGVMPEYGMHLAENRRGDMLFEVDRAVTSELSDVADYVALGGAIGFRAIDRVPVVLGLEHMTNEQAKAFCACVSPALIYPMIHVVAVTPEARTVEEAFGGSIPRDVERVVIGKKEVAEVFQGVRQTDNLEVDAAIIGCPFLTLQELAELADMLAGKKIKKPLWLHTDYVIYAAARKAGILQKIEDSGARVVHSVCPHMVDRDRKAIESRVFATDSLKSAVLCSGIGWPKWWLGTRQEAVNAAITGRFERTRWLL